MQPFKTFWISVLCCTMCAVTAFAGESISLTSGEWPPYFSESFKHGGLGSRICTEAFALEGIDVKYSYMPWKRSLEAAELGESEGVVGWRKTPEREKLFYFSDPIISVSTVFFHRKGSSFDWKTLDDVGNLTIGVTLGYTVIDILKPVVARLGGKIEVAPTDLINLQKLAAGRIDLFPCADAVGYYLLRTQFIPGTADLIKSHPKQILSGDIYLLISKKVPQGIELITRFNEGLRKLRENGLYNQYEEESLRGDYLPAKSTLPY